MGLRQTMTTITMGKVVRIVTVLAVLTLALVVTWMQTSLRPYALSHDAFHMSVDNLDETLDTGASFTPVVDGSCENDSGKNSDGALFDGFRKMVLSMVPSEQKRTKNFANPCWYMPMENFTAATHQLPTITRQGVLDREGDEFGVKHVNQELCCIPKVFLAGFPKSGSTTLYRLILRHTLVVGGLVKEPHFWTRSRYDRKFPDKVLLRYIHQYRAASRYIQHNPDALAIDGSQSTIWDTRISPNLCDVPSLMFSLIPDGKYIVIMREPVSRLYSIFRHFCRHAKSPPKAFLECAPALFHKAAKIEIKTYEKCLINSTINLCTRNLLNTLGKHPIDSYKCGQVRIGLCFYHIHIARWLKIIPKEQFLFLRTEDLADNPDAVMKRIWTFLGLKEDNNEVLGQMLYQHFNVNPLSSNVTGEMKPETKVMLHKFFQPFNKKLAELLGDDRFLWTDMATT